MAKPKRYGDTTSNFGFEAKPWAAAGAVRNNNDRHPDPKADCVLADPPFNDRDWRVELLNDNQSWVYGMSPAGRANDDWVASCN